MAPLLRGLVGAAALTRALGFGPQGGSRAPPIRVVRLFSSATDGVTGTKFEEDDETKNPQRRPGHQVRGMAPVDEATAAKQAAIRAHQEACPRLPWAEEIRAIAAQPKGFATLATISTLDAVAGFPSGSVVGFAAGADGRPVFCFAGMSGHTKNLVADARASLTVTEPDFSGAADARAVFHGRVVRVPAAEDADARAAYKAAHPNAFWADFGDFKMYRMDEVLDVSFVGGFARAGGVTVDEYLAADLDPCLAFSAPVMRHMNDDHSDSLKQYVEVLVGADPVKSAQMKRLDRFGFDVRVEDAETGAAGVLRVPFDAESEKTYFNVPSRSFFNPSSRSRRARISRPKIRKKNFDLAEIIESLEHEVFKASANVHRFDAPVTERGAIKAAIVGLSKKCAALNPDWQPHAGGAEAA